MRETEWPAGKISGRSRLGVRVWISSLIVLILILIGVGGVTRLTESGLSIVEWAPILGFIPPLNEGEWAEAFRKYQAFPQYRLMNSGMTLGEFKFIFFWEYLHRVLGRLVGLLLVLPLLGLASLGFLDRRLVRRLGLAVVLIGLQGGLGWFMVRSGLVDRPRVSHYRLAAHLLLALTVLSWLWWILLDLLRSEGPPSSAVGGERRRIRALLLGFTGLVGVQLFFGALVAGLRAGLGYNTFPLMMGSVISPDAFQGGSILSNLTTNPAMVQFIHRTLGWLTLLCGLALFAAVPRGSRNSALSGAVLAIGVGVALQFALGVATLLWVVPLKTAVAHQLGGCLLLLLSLRAVHVARESG